MTNRGLLLTRLAVAALALATATASAGTIKELKAVQWDKGAYSPEDAKKAGTSYLWDLTAAASMRLLPHSNPWPVLGGTTIAPIHVGQVALTMDRSKLRLRPLKGGMMSAGLTCDVAASLDVGGALRNALRFNMAASWPSCR